MTDGNNITMNDGSGDYIPTLMKIIEGMIGSKTLQQGAADSTQNYLVRAIGELKPAQQKVLNDKTVLEGIVNQFVKDNISLNKNQVQVITSEMESGDAWMRTRNSATDLVRRAVGSGSNGQSTPPAAAHSSNGQTNGGASTEATKQQNKAPNTNPNPIASVGNFFTKNFDFSLDGVKGNFTGQNATVKNIGFRAAGVTAGLGASYYFGRQAIRGTKVDPQTGETLPMSFVQRTGNAIAGLAGLAVTAAAVTYRAR